MLLKEEKRVKILFNTYKNYLQNNSILQIPESIKDRTQKYLELSCSILPWFKENYERTNDKEFIKIKEIYDNFATSNFFIIYQKKKKENITKLFSMNTLKQIYF